MPLHAKTMIRGLLVCLAGLALPAGAQAAPAPVTSGPNLIVNGGAESGAAAGSGYDTVVIPGWQIFGEPTVVRYGQHADGVTGTGGDPRGLAVADQFPTATTPGPPDRGSQLFVGGQVGSDTLTQTDSLTAAARAIDQGGVRYTLAGWLGGNGTDMSTASVSLSFLGARGNRLASAAIGPVSAADRLFTTELLQRSATGTIPPGARSAVVQLTLTDGNSTSVEFTSSYNNAYADSLSLHISAPVPAPPAPRPPASRVGRLDHVFMVFMENEGFNDIVGSPSAPYLNGLIDRYGLATDYHGVEHPSDDNYVAFFAGSTYGIDANCAPDCPLKERNLADEIEAAHKTWDFYEELMPSPCYDSDYGPSGSGGSYYTPDLLPWSYFTDLLDEPARCHAHDFPLPQMGLDLRSARTTANYVWFEADDYDDMEQGGIGAGDKWLAETLPTILNSPAFRNQRSAIFITWDEDYNNKTFNQDNQDNRVPTIVIPSPHSGMLSGHVLDGDYLTHYSLLRTIELSLGLPPMTLNDRYATPLNGFWPALPSLSRVRVTRSRGVLTLHVRSRGTASIRVLLRRAGRRARSITRAIHRASATIRIARNVAPGRYTVAVTPLNAAQVAGPAHSLRFTVRRR